MRITDEQGLLNNFAAEPEVYFAEPPTAAEKTKYVIQAACASVFLGVVAYVAFVAS
jgi:hypothetical protein